jgi:Raf kinase inhibitor-like YbhB/YbcL family protein
MQIKSSAFDNYQYIPVPYTCLGNNINPPLEFLNVPSNAKSLVLLVEDDDANPVPWVHWLVFNIPPTTNKINENSLPEGGIECLANAGTYGYEGPCPKFFNGDHHYLFRLFALDTVLNFPQNSDKDTLAPSLEKYKIKEATLIGLAQGLKDQY